LPTYENQLGQLDFGKVLLQFSDQLLWQRLSFVCHSVGKVQHSMLLLIEYNHPGIGFPNCIDLFLAYSASSRRDDMGLQSSVAFVDGGGAQKDELFERWRDGSIVGPDRFAEGLVRIG